MKVCLRTLQELEKSPEKDTFFFTFLKQQLHCATKESGRGFRWSKDIVHWALTLQFHGGKRVIDDLRGKASTGKGKHGKLDLNVGDWGIFLPGNSTLRNYLPPVEVYEGFKVEAIENFKQGYPENSPRKVVIAWDEIEIRYGLVWNPSTKELIGRVDGPIAEKDVKSANWAKMNEGLATHIIQFFLISADGAASLPIGFHPMTAINGVKVFNIVEPLFKMLKDGDLGLEVIATASDAFPSNATLMTLLTKEGWKSVHIFDPLHLLKSMRNNIWNQILSKDGVEFNLNTLDDLLKSTEGHTRRLFNSLHPGSPFPKDQMDLAPIRKLLSPELIEKLRGRGEQEARHLGEYLHNMRVFDQATTDNVMDNSERFRQLELVVNYFKSLKGLTSGLVDQLSTTVKSIKHVYDLSMKEGEGFGFRVSVLGTIVVENFFSTVRAKCRYPNLWEYAVFSRRALFELIKNNADDYLFIGPKKGQDQWKKYGNQRGINFSMDQIHLMSKGEKKKMAEEKRRQNQGSESDLEFCQEKGKEYRCKRKRMTVREIKSKDSPFLSKTKIEIRVRCPVPKCQKNYVYEGHLANHIFAKHSERFLNLEDAQLAAQTAYSTEYKLALKARAEDHGLVPEEESALTVDFDQGGLAPDDPEYLEEEELMTGSLSPRSPPSAPVDLTEFDHEVSRDMFTLWDLEAIEEYDLGSVVVNHVQLVVDQPQPTIALPPPPQLQLRDLFRPHEPPKPDFPPPFQLESGQSIRPMLIDFECNDFRHAEPIEMTVKCLIMGRVFTTLIKCEHPIHFLAYKVHGISRRMLEHEPDFRGAFQLLQEWLAYMGSDESEIVLFVAHNAPFDLRVMRKALAKEDIPFPPNWIFQDSIKMVKARRPGLPSYALGKLADTLHCINKPTHRSASDVACLTEIMKKIFGDGLRDVAKGIVQFVFQM